MWLSEEQRRVLGALAQGSTLKVHRDVDGSKIYKLHPLAGATVEVVAEAVVQVLQRRGLIDSNMKFPAAVYLLTDAGAQIGVSLTDGQVRPVGTQSYTAGQAVRIRLRGKQK
jgi:uncharacterized protein YjhX (UPF0386 family)